MRYASERIICLPKISTVIILSTGIFGYHLPSTQTGEKKVLSDYFLLIVCNQSLEIQVIQLINKGMAAMLVEQTKEVLEKSFMSTSMAVMM